MRAGTCLVALLLLSSFAGCVGNDDAPPEEPTRASEGSTATDARPGRSSPTPDPEAQQQDAGAQTSSSESESAPALPVSTPVSWDGKIATGACVPSGPGACFAPVSPFAGDGRRMLEAPGNVTRVSVTMTWKAATPLTEKLVLSLSRLVPCEDGGDCWVVEDIQAVEGASGLVLTADTPPLAPGERLRIGVDTVEPLPEPVVGDAHTEQVFHVEGEIVSIT